MIRRILFTAVREFLVIVGRMASASTMPQTAARRRVPGLLVLLFELNLAWIYESDFRAFLSTGIVRITGGRAPEHLLVFPTAVAVLGIGWVGAACTASLVKEAAAWLYKRTIVADRNFLWALWDSSEFRFVATALEAVCVSVSLEFALTCTVCRSFVPGSVVVHAWVFTAAAILGAALREAAATRRAHTMLTIRTIIGAMAVDASLPSGTDSTRRAVADNAIEALRATSAEDAVEVLKVCECPGAELTADQRATWEYMVRSIDALRAKRTT